MKVRSPAVVVLGAILANGFVHAQLQTEDAYRPHPVELSELAVKIPVPVNYSKPIRVSGGVVAGYLEHQVYPVFPPGTNCLRVNGAVVMHALIGKDGHVKSADAISGPEVMRQPNLDAMKQQVYRPFQLYGHPVEVETTLVRTVNFNNEGCSDR